jgi:putative membrane protein (TIGR04086 family)
MAKEIKYNLSERVVIYGLALLVGVITIVLTLIFSALFCFAIDLDSALISPLSCLCAGCGSFISSFLSSKKIKASGIINGLICGGMIFVWIFFGAMFFSSTGFSLISLLHAAIILISGIIGGVLGVVSIARKKII